MRVDGVLSKTKAHYNQLKNQGTLLRESRVNYNTHNTLLRNFGYLLLLLLLLLLLFNFRNKHTGERGWVSNTKTYHKLHSKSTVNF